MAETIDVESRKAVQLATDLDKQRRRYIVQDGDVRVQFAAPTIFNYERFFFYLLRHSTFGILPPKYYQRPDYLSYDQYNTTTLWSLLLFVNKVQSIEDFIGPKVYIPSYGSILEISKYNQELIDPLDVDELNAPSVNEKQLQVYYSKVRIPSSEDQPVTPTTEDIPLPSYLRQKFTINNMNLLNKYVDLGFVPIQETMDVKIIGNNTSLVYDAHYTIVEDINQQLKRLSWAAVDCTLGPGLESIIEVGTILDVMYVKEE